MDFKFLGFHSQMYLSELVKALQALSHDKLDDGEQLKINLTLKSDGEIIVTVEKKATYVFPLGDYEDGEEVEGTDA